MNPAAILLTVLVLATPVAGTTHPDAGNAVSAHQSKTHPMRYWLSLPAGWTPGRSWPVVVVIADAHRDFRDNLQRFVAARGTRPLILVAPEVVTCGGTSGQTSPPYAYTEPEWRAVQEAGAFAFDDAGLAAVLADVHSTWGGEEKPFLTGWEAGGHTVWEQVLRRPERWRAVAPVSTNYLGRGLESGGYSTAPERRTLPIQVFWCGAPTGDVAQSMAVLHAQTERALDEARRHGFTTRPDRVVAGADHGPLPEAVLAWFDQTRQAPRATGAVSR